jgi:hypothetical protein
MKTLILFNIFISIVMAGICNDRCNLLLRNDIFYNCTTDNQCIKYNTNYKDELLYECINDNNLLTNCTFYNNTLCDDLFKMYNVTIYDEIYNQSCYNETMKGTASKESLISPFILLVFNLIMYKKN